ncbi:PEP-utilizing enzyme [Proteus terrae]|uniref:PEP-utilizing enzyme n=1 Tax=Proteus terrae TaxID=1574161 RepID=UPI00331468AA
MDHSCNELNTNEHQLKGLAGSAGVIEGEVYLVYGPENFAEFPQNAILVARTTNPAWTALFYRASGIITESGGPLSHGAVTARELGLPAVMGIRNVLNILRNGQKVRVDGQKGIIEIMS